MDVAHSVIKVITQSVTPEAKLVGNELQMSIYLLSFAEIMIKIVIYCNSENELRTHSTKAL